MGRLSRLLAGDHNNSYLLPLRQRSRAVVHAGDHDRTRLALHKLLTGQDFKLVVLGGSISAGQGAVDAPGYVRHLEAWLAAHFPSARIHNGAVPGTKSSYMALCLQVNCPQDADLVVVEYAVNDHAHPVPPFVNPDRSSMERLLRRLLALPNHPAVVLLNAFSWHVTDPFKGAYWGNAEGELLDLATYYGVAMLSVKAAVYQLMLQGAPGFRVDNIRRNLPSDNKTDYFYYDEIHPNGQTGHRVMAELLITFVLKGMWHVARQPPDALDLEQAQEPLPPPMIPGNWPAANHTCALGHLFQSAVAEADQAWQWVNEAKGPRPKWGYVSREPGSTIRLVCSTVVLGLPPGVQDPAAVGNSTQPSHPSNGSAGSAVHAAVGTGTALQGGESLVQLMFLKSYEHMGRAMVKCEAGCQCQPSILDGHHTDRSSQLFFHAFKATASPHCLLAVTVMPDTSSGERKVKLAGLVVVSTRQREEAVFARTAEYVHDIAMRGWASGKQAFDVTDHVR